METDFLIIGSGISGLNFALNAAEKGKVLIVTKKKMVDSNTNYAQGGIAAVLSQTDNIKLHIKDTLEAGANHNDKKAVEFMTKNGAAAITHLIKLGVEFEHKDQKLKLTKEGGHSQNRIAYIGDHTGKEIESSLIKKAKSHPNITILENTFALNLITKNKTCLGVICIRKNKPFQIKARATIIATGGIGQLFKETTNPDVATGDGIAIAGRAKAKTEDMEFIQFHPTALNKKISPKFLISEAVRGEGAILVNKNGERFMENRHPLKELAPRDFVAREIYREQKSGPVYLKFEHETKKQLENRFPQIYKKLASLKIKMEKDLIPVTPAAHYLCGGIKVDLNGRTNIQNLFCFGEASRTGVHGANRLASNSLLEAVVFSNQIIKNLPKENHTQKLPTLKTKLEPLKSPKTAEAKKLKKEIKNLMWEHAGIIRNLKNIKKTAIPKLKKIEAKLLQLQAKTTNQQIAEALNMAQVGLLILTAAAKRQKSLGCHFTAEPSQAS